MPIRTCEKLERLKYLAKHNFSSRLPSKALSKKIDAASVKYESLTTSPFSRKNEREEKK